MTSPPESPRAILRALLHGAHAPDAAAALAAAAAQAQARGFVVLPLGVQALAEARDHASFHAAIALQSVRHGRPLAPTLLLSAGPVLRSSAPAGPADFLLALALALDENRAMYAAACGEGPTAFTLGPDTMPRALAQGLSPARQLQGGMAAAFFVALDETFVMDPPATLHLRALLITQE